MIRSPYLKSEEAAEKALPRKKPKKGPSAKEFVLWKRANRKARRKPTDRQAAAIFKQHCREVMSCLPCEKNVRAAARRAKIAARRARRAAQRSGK